MSKTQNTENNEKLITRTFPVSYTYDVYDFSAGKAEKKATIKVDTEPTNKEKKELKEKYSIKNLVLELMEKEEITLAMPISQFKENAKPLEYFKNNE